jgi:acetyltransferase-like isoleucine patch superfamily enzyme
MTELTSSTTAATWAASGEVARAKSTRTDRAELRRAAICRMLLPHCSHAVIRHFCYSLAWRLEGGALYSGSVRDILRIHFGVEVGAYSYGECLVPGHFPHGVRIGRYVSIAAGVRVFLRNHPLERLSMHPLFYNPALGFVETDNIPPGALTIEHDAWLGERAIVTPKCHRIGIGAVVGAGSIVVRDVPDFAIVAGNPAKLIRYRFDETTQDLIRQSRWWDRTAADLKSHLPEMTRALDIARHPVLSAAK